MGREVKEQRRKMRKEETVTVDLLHRAVPAKHIDEGLRALSGETPIHPESVQKYLESKFGDALKDVSNAMMELAKSLPPSQLAQKAYAPYEKFRPEIPPGKKGWGASCTAEPLSGKHSRLTSDRPGSLRETAQFWARQKE